MKNYLMSSTTAFKITNINFDDADKLFVIDPAESVLHELAEDISDETCIVSYVRSKLFYKYGVTFDVVEVAPFDKAEYDRIINLHETETSSQPFCADDADNDFEHISDDVYVIDYPKEFYCVVPDSNLLIIESAVDKTVYKEILTQLAFEYMLEVFPIKVVGTKSI